MDYLDLPRWVDEEIDPARGMFKKAVHTVLVAIASSPELSTRMILKGGILLAIRYNSTRYTTDIDFSTESKIKDFDRDAFISRMSKALLEAAEKLNYGVACAVQSFEIRPKTEKASFPTLKLRVGYADQSDDASFRRLRAGKSPTVVDVDYSFNEINQVTEILKLSDGGALSAYSFADLVAEKYRAILQQESRNRNRRQDVYDLFRLLTEEVLPGSEEKARIHTALIATAASREVTAAKESLRRAEIKDRSRHDYDLLRDEIQGELPDFEKAFAEVCDFYESLPW